MTNRSVLISVVAGTLLVGGCGGDDGVTPGSDAAVDNFDRSALLRNLADNVIVPAIASFDTSATALSTAVDGYCAALGTGSEATELTAAQTAWRAAMAELQVVEMMRIGPAADNDNELRDTIYSWPVISSCAIDQEVQSYFDAPQAYDITGVLTNRRGMFALEYVLFSASLDHTCDPPVAPAGWDALADADKRSARCGYASRAAADVATQAASLHSTWTSSFADELAAAGASGNSFGSAQAALNAVSDAMFYIDFEVKDFKVGESIGILENSCAVMGSACEAERESRFANHSKENIVSNLRAFDSLFHGGSGVGFDDMLTELGAEQLATEMSADIAAMIAAAEAVPGSWNEALSASYDDCAATHTAIKAVTDNFKTQFLTVLGLDFPDNLPTDND